MPRGHSVESIRPDRRAHGFGGGANGVGGRVVIAGGRAHRYVRPSGPALARRMRETACVKRRRAAAPGARRARREASVPCTANGSARGPPSGAAARRAPVGHRP
ncbi:hypothetical protein GBP346_B0800 [Burkholderia pseudomallei MSHR346]|nr:hypothetical protein GBP346_B0800 [Burkholderia pseudomallei MSHR346]